jgi:carbamoyltransferase
LFILGINAYHGDVSAVIVKDGELLAAVEEERFRRIKHWAGFPSQAIAYCLAEAGTSLGHVAHVAINSDPSASFLKKVGYALRQRPDISLILDRVRNQAKRQSIETELAAAFPKSPFRGQVHRVEHHLAHHRTRLSVVWEGPIKGARSWSVTV